MTLANFLARSGRTPFGYGPGQRDCLINLADWVLEATGVDPAAHLRGAYETEAQAQALVDAIGGAQAMVADCALRAGLAPTDDPVAGDVGVVRALGIDGPVIAGAICTGRRWVLLAVCGQVSIPAQPLAAWSVACRR